MIDEDAMRAAFVALRARVEYLERASGLFAPDASLDRPNGNPKVKFAPRDWRGPNFVGKSFSQCSPEFLEVLAESLSWAADNPTEGKEKFASYNRLDAARARSWARRIRSKAIAATPRSEPAKPTNGHADPTERHFDSDLFDEEDDMGSNDVRSHPFDDEEPLT